MCISTYTHSHAHTHLTLNIWIHLEGTSYVCAWSGNKHEFYIIYPSSTSAGPARDKREGLRQKEEERGADRRDKEGQRLYTHTQQRSTTGRQEEEAVQE